MLAWSDIDTLLLDLDGTLLDLHYDNHFWLEYVPRRYAEQHGLSEPAAREELLARYKRAEGTLDWYCVDYWTRELGLDIPQLKEEVDHLIAVHPHVVEFLHAVRALKKRIVLVTNAHGKAIAVKFRRTQLGGHFDRVVSSHDLRVPKEHAGYTPGSGTSCRYYNRSRRHAPFSSMTVCRFCALRATMASAACSRCESRIPGCPRRMLANSSPSTTSRRSCHELSCTDPSFGGFGILSCHGVVRMRRTLPG